MWNGKNKAVTFSYDDGVLQDICLVDIFNKYGLKATFNVNSELLGRSGKLLRNGVTVRHDKMSPEKAREVYLGHEVAAHTLTHPCLVNLNDEEIIRQVEGDRLALSELCGYEVVGMAYPGGDCDERVARIIRENTGVKYARLVESSKNFDLQEDLIMFRPTVADDMFALAEKFLSSEADKPQLFYIWGHSYEFDAWNFWERFEDLCRMISGRSDIFYGTNREVFGF